MSSGGLSLKAYLATTRGPVAVPVAALPPRPPGPLVWGWAEGQERGAALANLCARLQNAHPDIAVGLSGSARGTIGMPHLPTPPERLSACQTFANHLRPDVVLWAGLELAPALLHSLHETGAHMIAVDLDDAPPVVPHAPRFLPDPAPATLAMFSSLYATSEAAARRLRRQNLDGTRVQASAPLLETQLPLVCSDTLHEEMAGILAGRPVWLAARVSAGEAASVLAAHRSAVRLNHRLLLILAPERRDEADAIARTARDTQLRLCDWEAGETPDDNTQVLLTGGPDELGLWYRLAPLAFIGHSLSSAGSGSGGRDPFEAAALGTAVLYGPNVGAHLTAYARLVEAGAARIVRDTDSLAVAVSHLVAPDQAANMAMAGWDVMSSGADLVDSVISEIANRLDERVTA